MNKEKFDEIIDALVNKTTRLDDLINHLSVNVFRNTDGTFTHDDSNNNVIGFLALRVYFLSIKLG